MDCRVKPGKDGVLDGMVKICRLHGSSTTIAAECAQHAASMRANAQAGDYRLGRCKSCGVNRAYQIGQSTGFQNHTPLTLIQQRPTP